MTSLPVGFYVLQGSRVTPGVVYVGHLPLGLFEPQLRSYFEQFGTVLRLRLSRSKKVRKQEQLSGTGPRGTRLGVSEDPDLC